MINIEIFKLKSIYKDYIWGGTKLRSNFNKKCDLDKIAESWELSCYKDNESVIDSGLDSGLKLTEYIKKYGKSVLGTNCDRFIKFPVLIKLIDAKDNLSVQVHPDNKYALVHEHEYGKTEMWYIVDCEKDAELIYGFNKKITKEEFRSHIEDNTLTDVTNSVKVKKGDVFFIESGTLHAIGKGIVIAEIQQNSNTTYRIYDYGRMDNDGKPRELHIDKAVDVTNLVPVAMNEPKAEIKMDGYTDKTLSKCEYFDVHLLHIEEKAELAAGIESFNNLLVLNGKAIINTPEQYMEINKGDSIFIPASLGNYRITGSCEIILTKI